MLAMACVANFAPAQTNPQPATDGPTLAGQTYSETAVYTDPYRRYFSGHWCNCWRKVNMNPIDEEAVFAGVLPRSDAPVWMKHKLINMEGMDPDEKFLCRVFAGLVNRSKAQWYCQDGDDFWLQGRRKYYNEGITNRPIRGIWAGGREGNQQIGYKVGKEGGTSYLVGIKRFVLELDPPSIDGCILYDPALWDPNAEPKQPRDVLNVIRTMCAIERALPLTPRLYDQLMDQIGDQSKLPVIMDTTKREDWMIEKYHGDEKAAAYSIYAWAFNNFWENAQNEKRECIHHALCFMPPMGPVDSEQDITDYVVQWKIFCFYSEGGANLDEKHMEYVLTQSPMNIPVIGQLTATRGPESGEASTRLLRLFSRFGKYFIDVQQAGNLSIHSGERLEERFDNKQKPAESIALEPGKRYVAFCLTTNNSVGHYMNDRAYHWDYASRGSVPLGWGIPLAAADLVPNITKYYYDTMTANDCFVGDLGGLGVALPTVWGAGTNSPEQLLADYYKRSAEYIGYLDLGTIWAGWLDEQRLANLSQNAAGLKGVFYGTAGAGRYLTHAAFMQNNMPIVHTYADVVESAADLEAVPEKIAAAGERFCFIGVDESAFPVETDVVDSIAKVAGKLGDSVVVVRPDQLMALYGEAAKAGQAPTNEPELAMGGEAVKGLALKSVRDGAIQIDAKSDDWAKADPMKTWVTRSGEMTAQKPADAEIAAEISTAVDSRYLYILARVNDKQVVVDDANLTAGDCLELFLDTRSEAFREPLMTEGFYRMALVPAAGLVEKPDLVLQYPPYDVGLVSLNKNNIEHQLSSVVADGGYLIEAAVPLANFPHTDWKKGDRVAIGFAVQDYEPGAAPAAPTGELTASVDPFICRPAVID
jgi:hypothetical protein